VLIAGSSPVLPTNLLLVFSQVLRWKSKSKTSSDQSHRKNLLFKFVVIAIRGGIKENFLTMILTVSVLTGIID
jgi:hypothetical protein